MTKQTTAVFTNDFEYNAGRDVFIVAHNNGLPCNSPIYSSNFYVNQAVEIMKEV
jgi:hypothetical protein